MVLESRSPPAAAPARPRRKLPNPLKPLAPAWRNKTIRYSLLGQVLVLSTSIGGYFYFRPVPQPDYASDPMDQVLDYTLLTDEFNNLPIDKRLELLKDLIDRLKTMSAPTTRRSCGHVFAASINTDKLRKQPRRKTRRGSLWTSGGQVRRWTIRKSRPAIAATTSTRPSWT